MNISAISRSIFSTISRIPSIVSIGVRSLASKVSAFAASCFSKVASVFSRRARPAAPLSPRVSPAPVAQPSPTPVKASEVDQIDPLARALILSVIPNNQEILTENEIKKIAELYKKSVQNIASKNYSPGRSEKLNNQVLKATVLNVLRERHNKI